MTDFTQKHQRVQRAQPCRAEAGILRVFRADLSGHAAAGDLDVGPVSGAPDGAAGKRPDRKRVDQARIITPQIF